MKSKEIIANMTETVETRTLTRHDFVSTGSTLLNMAITGYPFRGFAKGKYYFLVGDSTSGKTFLSLTCLAEASINKNFDDYRFIYDNSEGGALMNIKKFFGSGVAKRIEAPAYEENIPSYSRTIEDFYYNVDDALDGDKPFIYILDSMDSLSSEAEGEKFQKQKKAHRAGKESSGTMTDGKARKNSSNIRQLLGPLDDTGCILLVINQTRDNLGFGFEKKTRSGGRALRFYATAEMWSSVKGRIEKTVKGKKRRIGTKCFVQTKKNRHTGREHKIEIPIHYDYGIDDVGSCVDYLVEEGHWNTRGNKIAVPEFASAVDITTRENLIRHIEETKGERKLGKIVANVWREIESACAMKRKNRYE